MQFLARNKIKDISKLALGGEVGQGGTNLIYYDFVMEGAIGQITCTRG